MRRCFVLWQSATTNLWNIIQIAGEKQICTSIKLLCRYAVISLGTQAQLTPQKSDSTGSKCRHILRNVYLKFCLTLYSGHTVVNHCPSIVTWLCTTYILNFHFIKKANTLRETVHVWDLYSSDSMYKFHAFVCLTAWRTFYMQVIQDSWFWTVTAAETIVYGCENCQQSLHISFRED